MRRVTGGLTGRSRHDVHIAVARGREHRVDIAVAADGAGMRRVTGGLTGRSRHDIHIAVALCCHIVRAVAEAAARADGLGIAVLLTGRFHDRHSQIVAKRLTDLDRQRIADRIAVVTLDIVDRGFGAGSFRLDDIRGSVREGMLRVGLPQEDRMLRRGAAAREGSLCQIGVHRGNELRVRNFLCGPDSGSLGLGIFHGADAALFTGALEVVEVFDDGICTAHRANDRAIGKGCVAGDRAEVEAAADLGVRAVADDTGGIVAAGLDRTGVVAGRDLAVGGEVGNDARCAGAGGKDVTGVDAAGDGAGLRAAGNVSNDTGTVAPAGDIAAVGAVGNIQAVVGAADDAADALVVAARALDGNVNVRMEVRQVGVVRAAGDTADVSIVNGLGGTGDNGAVDGHVLDLRAVGDVGAGDPAEQAAIERYRGRAAVVDGKVIHGVVLAVEGTGKLLRSGADGRPFVTGQIDVGRQDAGDLRAAAVDLLGKPSQLCAGADEVNAVFAGLRLGRGLAVPSVFRRLAHGELDGDHAVFDLLCVGGPELKGTTGADIAELLDGVGVGAVAELIGTVSFRRQELVIAVLERGSEVFEHVAVFIHGDELDAVVDLPVDLDRNIRQAAGNKADVDRGEVRADAGVGHIVQRIKRAGSGVHTAGDIAVGDHNGRFV